MICVDANVWVAALRPGEPFTAESAAFLRRVRAERIPLAGPTLVLAEVAGSLARRTGSAELGREAVAELRATPRFVLVSLGALIADRAAELAAMHRLRGADAVYAATAAHLGATLVTWDDEVVGRLAGVVPVLTPAAWLASHPA